MPKITKKVKSASTGLICIKIPASDHKKLRKLAKEKYRNNLTQLMRVAIEPFLK